jgi:hypothetical protein
LKIYPVDRIKAAICELDGVAPGGSSDEISAIPESPGCGNISFPSDLADGMLWRTLVCPLQGRVVLGEWALDGLLFAATDLRKNRWGRV